MQGKLKKEQLLRVLSHHKLVEKLPRQALEELCRVFKVDDSPPDYDSQLQHFRSKMADIYTQEGDGYLDYLQLPKFRALPPELSERMLALFRKGWHEYQQFKVHEQASLARKEVEELTPAFDSLDSMHHFHLNLLQIYRDSAICPRPPKPAKPPAAEPKQSSGFLYAPPAPQQPSPIMYFPYQPNFPKVEAPEGMPYILNEQHPNLFDIPFGMPNPYFPQTDYYPQQPEPKRRPDPKKDEPQVRNLFAEDHTAYWSRFANYEFIQCACEGKKGNEERGVFTCNKCAYKYHSGCLGLDLNPVAAICPLCILRKENIFCKVVKEPVKTSWHLHENGKELRVEMTDEESHQIHEACKRGYQCQIRFLKIDGSSLRKDKKPLDGFSLTNGCLHKVPKHTEITLPELSEDRSQPISLQILLRAGEGESPNDAKIYLFAVFLIETRKADDIVRQLFSSNNFVTPDYYEEWRDEEGKVVINLRNSIYEQGLIRFPVRGSACKHLEVFDFKMYLEMVSELKRDNETELTCPSCSEPCPSFTYDKFVYGCIQNLPNYAQAPIESIQIERNGEFAWVEQEKADSIDDSPFEEMESEPEPVD